MDIFNNKKKQTTDAHNHMDVFQKHYVDQKKSDTICKIPFYVVLGHVGLGCGNGNLKVDASVLRRGREELSGVMEMFHILIQVVDT